MKDINLNLVIPEDNHSVLFLSEDKLKGFLEHLRLLVDDYVDIGIFILPFDEEVVISDETIQIIFEMKHVRGNELIFLRETALDKEGKLLNYSQQKYLLNDKIGILIRGKSKTELKLQLRLN